MIDLRPTRMGQNTLSQIHELTKLEWAKKRIACGRIVLTFESTSFQLEATWLCETTVIRNGNFQIKSLTNQNENTNFTTGLLIEVSYFITFFIGDTCKGKNTLSQIHELTKRVCGQNNLLRMGEHRDHRIN